jgi:hypothetical protein
MDRERGTERNHLNNRLSFSLEQQRVHEFFEQNGLDLKVKRTSNVNGTRIFLHDFSASEEDIQAIIRVLAIDSVSAADFKEVHAAEFSREIDQVHSPVGQNYLEDPAVWFYKGESEDSNVGQGLGVDKVYLYYNKDTQNACFQVFYNWG